MNIFNLSLLILQNPPYELNDSASGFAIFSVILYVLYIAAVISFFVLFIFLYIRIMTYFKLKNKLMQRELDKE
ncbi:hypothetical protein [Psychroserpens luteolus]|uniref:hypothetical protein n=1 Tax=Psychroserpens luteolus TaxID=2855840 RepID=UPI001E2EE9F9|nr:hypothetical protein [Psychroserpens luteolus]MCD2257956.1 hypothetical protein [Psychroserpens luteolus]